MWRIRSKLRCPALFRSIPPGESATDRPDARAIPPPGTRLRVPWQRGVFGPGFERSAVPGAGLDKSGMPRGRSAVARLVATESASGRRCACSVRGTLVGGMPRFAGVDTNCASRPRISCRERLKHRETPNKNLVYQVSGRVAPQRTAPRGRRGHRRVMGRPRSRQAAATPAIRAFDRCGRCPPRTATPGDRAPPCPRAGRPRQFARCRARTVRQRSRRRRYMAWASSGWPAARPDSAAWVSATEWSAESWASLSSVTSPA